MSRRSDGCRQPNSTPALAFRATSPGSSCALTRRGVNPMSCMTAYATTNTAASRAERTRYGSDRSTWPSSPPPTVPTSIAAPVICCPRAKTRSRRPR
jgi:hypothetical protein